MLVGHSALSGRKPVAARPALGQSEHQAATSRTEQVCEKQLRSAGSSIRCAQPWAGCAKPTHSKPARCGRRRPAAELPPAAAGRMAAPCREMARSGLGGALAGRISRLGARPPCVIVGARACLVRVSVWLTASVSVRRACREMLSAGACACAKLCVGFVKACAPVQNQPAWHL